MNAKEWFEANNSACWSGCVSGSSWEDCDFMHDDLTKLFEAAQPKWLPIESAPKDGTEIMVYREDAGSMLAQWIAPCDFLQESHMINFSDEDWEEADWFYASIDTGGRLEPPPTLWQHKPKPPQLLFGVPLTITDTPILPKETKIVFGDFNQYKNGLAPETPKPPNEEGNNE